MACLSWWRPERSSLPSNPWLERARASLVASFANGVTKDQAAVSAAITSPWSNGQTEGQITNLKLVKRQMYGRAKLDLLQARLIGAMCPPGCTEIASESKFDPLWRRFGGSARAVGAGR